MITACLWWLAQLAGISGICYLVWWAIDYFAPPAPFHKIMRGAVALVAVIVLIWMILKLFVILGHPIS